MRLIEKTSLDFEFDIESSSLRITDWHCTGLELDVKLVKLETNSRIDSTNLMSRLPDELYLEIFKYLDLKDLISCAEVSWRWRRIAFDWTLYTDRLLKNVSINKSPNQFIFFFKNCKRLKNLTLDVDSIDNKTATFLNCFLEQCGRQLTNLSITTGSFVNQKTLQCIGECEELNVLSIQCVKFNLKCYHSLSILTKLVTLDLSTTDIDDNGLIMILKNNPNLEHLVIDECNFIQNLDEIASAVARYNKKLIKWSSEYVTCTTNLRLAKFSECVYLKELKWKFCFVTVLQSDIGIATLNCPDLEKLVIWGELDYKLEDKMLFYVLRNLKALKHLEICYNSNISAKFFNLVLKHFSNLENLVVSFNDIETIERWRLMYPGVMIKNIDDSSDDSSDEEYEIY